MLSIEKDAHRLVCGNTIVMCGQQRRRYTSMLREESCLSNCQKRTNFKLTRATIAAYGSPGAQAAVIIPAGDIVEVNSIPEEGTMVEIQWSGRSLQMFKIDLAKRGRAINGGEA